MDTLQGGVEHVVNRPPEGWEGQPTWRVEEVARLSDARGTTDGFRQFAVGPGGSVYVYDGGLLAFGPDGEIQGQRQASSGPLSGTVGIGIGPDGRVWLPRLSDRSYAAFTSDLEPAGSRPAEPYFGIVAIDSMGRLYDVGRDPREPPLIRYDLASTGAPDRLPFPEHTLSLGTGVPPHPYQGRAVWALDRGGHLWISDGRDYRLVQRTVEGDTLRVVESWRPGVPIPQKDRDRLESELPSDARAQGMSVGDAWPPVLGLTIDDEDRVWVRVPTADSTATVFDVFSADGRYVATAEAPFPIRTLETALVIREGRMYGVRRMNPAEAGEAQSVSGYSASEWYAFIGEVRR